jgi:hypothetical protein
MGGGKEENNCEMNLSDDVVVFEVLRAVIVILMDFPLD